MPSDRINRRAVMGAALGLAASMPFGGRSARADDANLIIGVLTDQSGPLADDSGPGSMIAAQMAIDDFKPNWPDRKVKLVGGDHLNKPDLASSIARRWFENDNVSAIFDLANSSAALAVQFLGQQKGKITIATTAGATALTGKSCSPTGFVWAYDNHAVAAAMATGLSKLGKKTWFFITADYAFGASLEGEMRNVIARIGGNVVGSVKHPLNSSDMSSYIVQAISSKAEVIVLANGGFDLVTTVKQAKEFGLSPDKQMLVTPLMFVSAVKAIGLRDGQGLKFASGYDWTARPESQKWADRFLAQHHAMPSQSHAAVYSAVTHYLKAVQMSGSVDGKAVAEQMRKMPVRDAFTENGVIRPDGLLSHDMYVLEVKAPKDSTSDWDLYNRVAVVSGEQANVPLAQSECALSRL
jgi:branched-chain amino acid transport system substrate-binding protein